MHEGRSRNAAAAIAWAAAIAIVCGIPILLLLALVPELAAVARSLAAGLDELEAQMTAAGAPTGADASVRSAVDSIVGASGSAVSGIVSAAADVITIVVLLGVPHLLPAA